MPHNFITNAKTRTLSKRLEQLIAHSQELKFLVGFFYFSGWQELYKAFQEREDLQLKILVGLNVQQWLGRTLESAYERDTLSGDELADQFFASLNNALNLESLDTQEFHEQITLFTRMIEEGRLHIKKTLNPNHAKLYLFRVKEELEDLFASSTTNEKGKKVGAGKFITGSSNLTFSGLRGREEFNVEISDYGWEDAQIYFDELWEKAVPITEIPQRKDDLLHHVRHRSQAAEVMPFEAYMLVLKTYLDLMALKEIKPHVVRLLEENGYIPYSYQMDAVNQALSIIGQYNGVIIADVVGLGKSVIAGMLARNLGKRGMVIAPPALLGDPKRKDSGWQKYIQDFQLYGWEARSSGDLKNAAAYLQEHGDDLDVIIVDEAHRFRNQDTEAYEWLSAICRNRTVILLTATPFNNTPNDVFSLLKLFIVPGKSQITLDENLEGRFARYNAEFYRLSYIMRYYKEGSEKQERAEKFYVEVFDAPLPIQLKRVKKHLEKLAQDVRTVLEPVLIRRNRLDLKNDPVYAAEITELSDLQDPAELFFDLSESQSAFYDRVVNEFFCEGGIFKGAIYQPFSYEEGEIIDADLLDEEGNRAYNQQRNLYDFMRRMLVKRFESSFGAFAQSIANFERIHELVLHFIENSGGKYILDRQLIEKIYENDADEIAAALDAFEKKLASQEKRPKNARVYDIAKFDLANQFLVDIRADLDLMKKIRERVEELDLVAYDPKLARLIRAVREILSSPVKKGEPIRKVVVFSEYVDTVKHIRPELEKAFPDRVLAVEGTLGATLSREILHNFDASVPTKKQEHDFDILLTSDKLSEGVNLNQAGAVINYDIPWNPTRVIQRVGRINRIGRKVFSELHIYNFFPTEQGADIVKSREIAAQKMFLIHHTLGEDAKIFALDETPSAAELYRRVNRAPDEGGEESLLTLIRQRYLALSEAYPEVLARVQDYPPRVKTAKAYSANHLTLFRRKGLGIFIQHIEDTHLEKPEVTPLFFEEALALIECSIDEPRLFLSSDFWRSYEVIKAHKEITHTPKSEISLEKKSLNNLQSALRLYKDELYETLDFIRTLIADLHDYKTLPKFTLRRLAKADLQQENYTALAEFKKQLAYIRNYLGDDYLQVVKERLASTSSEIIIAIENQSK
jgi:superfamily II DNA or RNA helicase/HKD family nuclease